MKRMKLYAVLLLLVMLFGCSQFGFSQIGLSQTRHRAPATKLSSVAKSETNSTPKDEGPSLEDTVSWLNQNVIHYAFVDTKETKEQEDRLTFKENNSIRLSSFTISGCSLSYVTTQSMNEDTTRSASGDRYSSDRATAESHWSVVLSDLKAAPISVSKNTAVYSKIDVFSVGVSADNGAKVVKMHQNYEYHNRNFVQDTSDDKYNSTDQAFPYISFQFPDEVTANRVAKAFARAITLCKKKQPF